MAEIQNDYMLFGMQLLEDRNGQRVTGFETAHRGDPAIITVAILQQWFQGNGRLPVTWQILVQCLQTANLNAVASDIEDALFQKTVTMRNQQQPAPGM